MNNWNSVDLGNATEFSTKWVNYFDGDWKAIDCLLVQDGTGFHVTNAPFTFDAPLMSDGEAVFNVTNKWDIFNKTEITADPFSQTIKALGVDSVSGELYDINGDGRLDAVKYPNAYGMGIHLVYYVHHGIAPRLKKLIQFDSALGIDTEYEFEIQYSGNTEISPRRLPDNMTRFQHRNASDVTLNTPERLTHDDGFYIRKRDESQKRGIGIKKPLIWDSATELKVEVIDVDIRKGVGQNKYILTKYIKASYFTDVTYPVFTDTTSTFYPDPHPETTSVDGHLRRSVSSESWATIRDSSVGTSAFPSIAFLECRIQASTTLNQFKFFTRSIVGFDTSSLGTDSIDSATLSLHGGGFAITNALASPTSTITSSSPASNTDLVVGDYDVTGYGATHLSNDIVEGSWNISAYNDHVLNASGLAQINGSGVSNFGWRLLRDTDNSEPTWISNATLGFISSSADEAGTSQDPKLVVIHTAIVNTTTVGVATAIDGGAKDIDVSMPYTDDDNTNNTYTIDYKLSADVPYTNWVTTDTNTPSPYTNTITGLVNGETYDVKVTYNDTDGVTGTNPQTITNIALAWVDVGVTGFVPSIIKSDKTYKIIKNDSTGKIIKRTFIPKVVK